jgi:hypothetical protein
MVVLLNFCFNQNEQSRAERVLCLGEVEDLSMAPPKNHAVGDLLIVPKLEFIWFTCCILMENS